MTLTEQWTEEKLIEELSELTSDYCSKIMGQRRITPELTKQIHRLYKEHTYLKGNKELPKDIKVYFAEVADAIDKLGFKSTKEWKK